MCDSRRSSRVATSATSGTYSADLEGQAQAQQWIEQVTGESFEGVFADELRDGRRLCLLINGIKPGSVKRVNASKMPFKQMENISSFLKACRSVGVPEYSLFETVDLFELKDLGLVVKCLHALGGTVQLTCPEFQGPHLGLKPAAKSSPKKKQTSKTSGAAPSAAQTAAITVGDDGASPPPFDSTASQWTAEVEQAKGKHGDLPPPPYQDTPKTAGTLAELNSVSSLSSGFSQAVHVTKISNIETNNNHVTTSSSSARAQSPPGPEVASLSPPSNASGAPQPQPCKGRGGGYGLDAELAAKREANYDYQSEHEAQEWIEAVTGEPFAEEFGEELRNGRRLCLLINEIRPGAVRRVNDSRMPFKQMENISNFLKACRAVGVAEYSLFETVDLFEAKDLGLVVRCLHALGQTVQKTCPDYEGPRLGIRQTDTNKREWTQEQQQDQMRKSSGAMTQLMAGSSATMERGNIIKEGVTFGASTSGTGDASSAGLWTMGSATTMERTNISKMGPTFGAEYAGTGDSSSVSKVTQGFR